MKTHSSIIGLPGFDPWVGKIPWRREWQPTPVLLPGESPWTEEPGRLQLMGSQRVRHTLVTERQQQHHLFACHLSQKPRLMSPCFIFHDLANLVLCWGTPPGGI